MRKLIVLTTCLLLALGAAAQKSNNKQRPVKTMFNCNFDVVSGLAEVVKIEKVVESTASPLQYDEYRIVFRFEAKEGAPLLTTLQDQDLDFFLRKEKNRINVGPQYLKQYQVRVGTKYAMKLLQPQKDANNQCFCTYWFDDLGGLPNDLFEARDRVQDLLKVKAEQRLLEAEAKHGFLDKSAPTEAEPSPAVKPNPVPKPTKSNKEEEERQRLEAEKKVEEERLRLEAEQRAAEERQRLEAEKKKQTQPATGPVNPEGGDINEDLIRKEVEAKVRAELEEKRRKELEEKERQERERKALQEKEEAKNAKKRAKEDAKRQKELEKQKKLEEEQKQKAIEAEKERIRREIENEVREKLLKEEQEKADREKIEKEKAEQERLEREAQEKQQAEERAKKEAFEKAKADQAENEIKRMDCKYGTKVSGVIKITEVNKVREANESLFNYAEYEIRFRFIPDNIDDIPKKDRKVWEQEQVLILDPMGKSAMPSASYIRKFQVMKDRQYKGFAQLLESGICTTVSVFSPQLPIDAGQVK